MRRIAALAVSVSVLLWVPAASGIINIPSSTSFTVEAHGISGVLKSRNPRCRSHRTVLLTLRALTEEESGLDFHERAVHTGRGHSWHLSTGIPAKAFTLEVELTAKSLGNSQGSNQCLDFFKERGYNTGR